MDFIEERKQAARDAAGVSGLEVNEAVEAVLQKAFEGLIVLGEDPKYGIVIATQGSPAHPGEPCFPIRGRDAAASSTIHFYGDATQDAGASVECLTSLTTAAQHLREWQQANDALVHPAT